MNKKRGQNEGSIRQRSDGRWEALLSLGYENGKAKRKSFYGATRKEAQEKLTRAMRMVTQGLPIVGEKQTLGEYLTDWLKVIVEPSTRPKTYHSYAQMVRLHIMPDLGKIPLAKLTAQDVQRLINAKSKTNLSARTVSYIRAILRNALNQAIKWDLVTRNVAQSASTPQVRRHEQESLSPDQASVLIRSLEGQRLAALFTVALAIGLRIGEATGLRWNDIDLDKGQLTVRNQLQRIGGEFKLVPPKTSRGFRTVSLPSFAIKALKHHREVQQVTDKDAAGERWTQTGFVFTSALGTPLDDANVRRTFREVLKKAELPHMRFHDLRHTCASLLLAQGVAPRVVMEILGHSQISLTMDTYSHVIPSLQVDAANLMNSLITNAN